MSVIDSVQTDHMVQFLGEQRKGISGSTLKWIAIITMFIDHIGAVILERYSSENTTNAFLNYIHSAVNIWWLDEKFREIGRLAFPIFCFLLVEGFLHTKNRGKYAIRLGIFALISEIPFDIAFRNSILDFQTQNVFFTLLIGLGTMSVLEKVLFKKGMSKVVRYILIAFIVYCGMYIANLCATDYGEAGVAAIVVMYALHNFKKAEMYGGCLTLTYFNLMEAYAFIDVIFVALYNGKRGLKMKYVFYFFYPVHLLLLAGITHLMGIVEPVKLGPVLGQIFLK